VRVDRLVVLLHRRWAVPVLGELHRGHGAKFVTLVKRLGASREAVRLTLADLIGHGWVRRNPGYGHPLRPEYVLTASGARIAPACARLIAALRRLRAEAIGLRKWSLPVLGLLRGGAARFGALRAGLPITDRALAQALKGLEEAGLVERRVVDDYPPHPLYRLTPRGRRVAPLLEPF
jgi:DNA-binding HxlR family transcriptional regulator